MALQKLFITIMLGLTLTASPGLSNASGVAWDWNNSTTGAAGWNAQYISASRYAWGPFIGQFPETVDRRGIVYRNDFGNGYVSADESLPFVLRGDLFYERSKMDFNFSSAPFQGATGVKLVSFDVKTSNQPDITTISIAGKTVSASVFDVFKSTATTPGWTHYVVPVSSTIATGNPLSIGLSFVAPQDSVSVDNVVATISDPSKVKVNVNGTIYTVPIGYSNFTGALDANSNPITVTADVAGKLLATSQALGELANFNPKLGVAANSLVDAARTIAGVTMLSQTTFSVLGILSPSLSPADEIAADLLSAMTIYQNRSHYEKLLTLAAINASAVSKASDNIVNFQSLLSSARANPDAAIDLSAIAEARYQQRVAEGGAHSVATVVNAVSESTGAVKVWKTFVDEVKGAVGGAVLLGATVQAHQLEQTVRDNASSLEQITRELARNIDSQVWSPLDSRGLSTYEQIAVERGYTVQAATNPLSGVVSPTLVNAVLLGQPTETAREREFALSVAPQISFFIDPVVATGFEYVVDEGPNFASIALPTGFGNDIYDLWLYDLISQVFVDSGVDIVAGQEYQFGIGGTNRFQIRGIEADAGLDPFNHIMFVADIKFNDYGDVTMRVNPLIENVTNSVPEPGSIALALLALVGLVGFQRRC